MMRSNKLRKLAQRQDCTVRLTGICNFNPETTVLAHVGTKRGMGIKCGDNMAVFACSSCHDEIDRRTSILPREELFEDILRALEETQEIAHNHELMELK